MELTSPGNLTRMGWTRRSFNPGDQIELSSDPSNGPVRYARAILVKVAVPAPTGTAHRTAPASHIRPYNAEEERLRQKGRRLVGLTCVQIEVA